MSVIINRSGRDLIIPEIRKIIPFDGKRYIVSNDIALKYRSLIEIVPIELQEKVKDQTTIIEEMKKKSIIFDIFRNCELDISVSTFDFLYPFHFEKNLEESIQRLRISIKSIQKQNVRICICNTSPKCIKSFLNGLVFDYVHLPQKLNTYCKSKTINLGVKSLVKSKYFFTSDIDLVYPPNFISYMSLFTLVKKPVRVIFSNFNIGKTPKIPFNFEECKQLYNESKDTQRAEKFYAPGNGLVHLDTFKKIGGYDERFIGHGSEDSEFNYRMSKLNKYFSVDLEEVNTYHLWHEYSTNTNERVKINEQQWRYIVWKGETEHIPLIKAGEIEFPPDLLERDWSLVGRDFI